MEEIAMLTRVSSKSKSFKATIPMGSVKWFNLLKEDKLVWEIRAEDGKPIML